MLSILLPTTLATRLQLPGHPPCNFCVIPLSFEERAAAVPLNRHIYPNLKLRIYTAGLRQNRLARMVGIDEAYLSKIINGFREPSGSLRDLIAGALKSDPEWLFQKIQVTTEAPLAERVKSASED